MKGLGMGSEIKASKHLIDEIRRARRQISYLESSLVQEGNFALQPLISVCAAFITDSYKELSRMQEGLNNEA